MSSKMLIDASHPEETRVVVLKGHRVEEFDFESANKKQLRGNIYLAKVTRVEPSLQAAFVDYGGNRHGFLAFSEIHPDYYQIPHADRQALLEEEARAHRDEDDEGRSGNPRRSRRHRRDNAVSALERRGTPDDSISEPASEQARGDDDAAAAWSDGPAGFDGETDETFEAEREFSGEGKPRGDETGQPASDQGEASDSPGPNAEHLAVAPSEPAATEAVESVPAAPDATAVQVDHPDHRGPASEPSSVESDATRHDRSDEAAAAMLEGGGDSPLEPQAFTGDVENGQSTDDPSAEEHEEDEVVEQIGGDALEDASHRPSRPRRHYKIQEVIKRRQILLIQVVKEERGNKGAALTTYLSLAGRYSVLMPNTARGGGISRKITDAEDRKRLKAIAQDLEVPEGMGIILRTAGAARGKVEVTRDFEYLLRMWESVRELTLKSTAPTLVYEEGSLIKRSIRDLYSREIDEVVVAGEEGYREAKEFMRMLMPGAAKSVQLYRDPQPIFAKAGAEAQLDAMFSNHVTLKSGGYLVINQTEALVAIDVNSGRSTREHNIEDTALRTNLEAADEVARQLRLRDLAGLIVVDFIDMEEGRNNRAVERRIKEALKNDRARIQIGRISHFGLLEMSRQRIRTGVLEGSTVICPHCAGAGTVRSTASIALHVLRLLEDALIKDASHDLIVRTRTEVALYILNQKRSTLTDLEARFGVSLTIAADPALTGMIYHAIERGELATPVLPPAPRHDLVRVDSIAPLFDEAGDVVGDDDIEDSESGDESDSDSGLAEREFSNGDGTGEAGRRRKRRRRRRGRDRESSGEVAADAPQPSDDALATMAVIEGDLPTTLGRSNASDESQISSDSAPWAGPASPDEAEVTAVPPTEDGEALEPPRRRRSRRNAQRPEEDIVAAEAAVEGGEADIEPSAVEETEAMPKRRSRARGRAVAPTLTEAAKEAKPSPALSSDASDAAEQHAAKPAEQAPELASGAPAVPPATESDGDAATEMPPATPYAEHPRALSAESEPARPKRSGWWQRAKATFGS